MLFTDIEGSTHLLQQLGARYAELLTACRQLLRTAPSLVGLPGPPSDRYHNAADLMLEQAARNLPLFPAAASAHTYRWKVDDAVSPWFLTERGQSLGEGFLNVGVTFGRTF